MLNTSTGRVFFFKLRVVVSEKTAEKAAIIFHVGIVRARETI
jgi:hypothetical protein